PNDSLYISESKLDSVKKFILETESLSAEEKNIIMDVLQWFDEKLYYGIERKIKSSFIEIDGRYGKHKDVIKKFVHLLKTEKIESEE
ncbi:MAG: hypothetical protein ACPLSA_05410, partial [Caldanaerobacter sp.]